MSQLRIHSAYALDAACFLGVLTGDEFYVSRHRAEYVRWAPRLSAGAKATLAKAVELHGSAMLGPALCYTLSACSDFAVGDPAELLRDPVGQAVVPVLRELDELGFRAYWTAERLPLVGAAAASLEQLLATSPFDLGAAVAGMLGPGQPAASEGIDLYLCTFAAPHGIRILGSRFVSDVQYKPETTVRIAIHEMFHPPYQLADVAAEAAALIADPLFQEAFRTKDPKYGYETETGFLEENVVEAMELYVSTQAGLMADPFGYLREHDGGSHKLSVVLLAYFNQVKKNPDEPFSAYLKRLTQLMPIGRLQEVFDRQFTSDSPPQTSR